MPTNKTFSIPRFLIAFFLLAFSFFAYVGILSPGGKMYSLWLDKNANVPAWLTYFICQSAKGLLRLFGYDVYQKRANNVTIVGSPGVNIIWACLGFRVLIFWVAFVIAHYANWKYKVKWMAIGITTITAINIIRIALIAVAFHNKWKAFTTIEPHFAFNVVSYIAIFILAFCFVHFYNKHQKMQHFKNETKGNVAVNVL